MMKKNEFLVTRNFLSTLVLLASLGICLFGAIIGILGSCESLVAGALYSLIASFMVMKVIFANKGSKMVQQSLKLASFVIMFAIVMGILDITIFSIVRIYKASKGLLMEPGIITIILAVGALIVNIYFYYEISKMQGEEKLLKENDGFTETTPQKPEDLNLAELKDIIMIGIIVPLLVVVGSFGAREVTLYLDAIAALCITFLILVPRVITLVKDQYREFTQGRALKRQVTEAEPI